MKILVADDEYKMRETIYDYMTYKGEEVVLAENGKEAVEKAYAESFDLVILDVMMPVLDGIEACKEIRQELQMPIIFLSALGEEEDYLKGFGVGADDYINKPFPLSVLHQKCQALVSRYKGVDNQNKLSIDGVTLDFNTMRVDIGDSEVSLSKKDFELLAYLMKNKGCVIERDAILTQIWGYDYEGDTRVVDTHIKRIRRQLKDKGGLIKTKVNAGYYI